MPGFSSLRHRPDGPFAAFALLSLVWILPLQASEPRTSPQSKTPRLLAQVEDRQVPLELESLEAQVRIHGFLAETTLEMTFFNSDPRLLEGEFLLWLPDGAVVCGFGLDVEGEMVDAVVVEKQKARIVFERETRRRIDPGLIEWSDGNHYRTRIYPIEGESRRTIRVRYIEQLGFHRRFLRRQAIYRLPLRGLGPLENVELQVDVVAPKRRPLVREHPFVELRELDETAHGGGVSIRAQEHNVSLERDLEVVLRSSARSTVMAEEVEGRVAFVVADSHRPRRRSGTGSRPCRVAVFWDASFSQAEGDRDRALEVLSSLLRRWRSNEILLTVFRHQAQAPLKFEGRDGIAELVETLAAMSYDGASGWQDLELPSDFDADAALLFSDGRINFGSRKPPELGVPTFVFDAVVDSNSRLLQHLAERSGGSYVDLTTTQPSRAVRQILRHIRRPAVALSQVLVDRGTVEQIEVPLGHPTGPTLAAGFLAPPSQGPTELTLRYGPGGAKRRFKVEVPPGPGSGLPSTFWAKLRLDRLALFPDENRQGLLELGRRYGLVTPTTSLLVLENVEQYVDYEVEPPVMLDEMRREYDARMNEMETEIRDLATEHLELLDEQWREFIDGVEKTYDIPPPGSLSPESADRRTTEGETSSAPATEPEMPDPRDEEVGRNEEPAADPPRDLQWAPARHERLGVELPAPQTVGGIVSLDDGTPIPGASVKVESASLLEPLTLVTNVDGIYRTPVLTPGQYEFEFHLEGFSVAQRSVQISRGDALELDVELSAAVEETITVTSEAVVLTSSAVMSGSTVDDGHEEGPSRRISIQPWNSEMPYLDVYAGTEDDDLYSAYLAQRLDYGSSPAFYFDTARHLFERGLHTESLRAASTLLELGVEDPRLTQEAASFFLHAGDWQGAVSLFESLVRLRPERPQSRRDLALALIQRADSAGETEPEAARNDYERAADLLYSVAFEPWGAVPRPLRIAYFQDGRFEEISRIALVEYNWVRAKLEELSPGTSRTPTLDAKWTHDVSADLRIVLAWSDEFADMDLWVIEPTGEKVFYGHPQSAIGGQLSEDCTLGLGPESYTLRTAMPGTYRILVNYYSDAGPDLLGPVTAQTTVFTGFGTESEQMERQSVRLESAEDTVEIGRVVIEE